MIVKKEDYLVLARTSAITTDFKNPTTATSNKNVTSLYKASRVRCSKLVKLA